MSTLIKPDKETLQAWHDDPANWRLAVFYYNKLDKRILPPKRIQGMGWTVNFAKPVSYLSVFGIIILLVVLINYLF
jgi:uncharacterized membrane protein